jgi:hypothetical protein
MSRILRFGFVAILAIPSILYSQWICIGKDGKPCTDKDVDEMVCLPEKAPANLTLAHDVRLQGTLLDSTGAAVDFDKVISDSHTVVQLRNPKTGETLFDVPLRANGGFEFEVVPAGTYRLIAVWMKNGKLRRLPLADQPSEMSCTADKECRITAVISFHGTDNPVDSCPPK